jgi:hypothetical protein
MCERVGTPGPLGHLSQLVVDLVDQRPRLEPGECSPSALELGARADDVSERPQRSAQQDPRLAEVDNELLFLEQA